MSPEQIRDPRFVDGRSDIWALGAILYTLLAGHPPFAGPTSSGTLAKIVADPVPPLRDARPDVPAELEAIVLGCLEKSPEQRIQRVEVLASALSSFDRFLREAPPQLAPPAPRSLPPPAQVEPPLPLPLAAPMTGPTACSRRSPRPPSRPAPSPERCARRGARSSRRSAR